MNSIILPQRLVDGGQRFRGAMSRLQSPLLLALRLYWGWAFFTAGKGKLMNLRDTADFFASLHIPFPALKAAFAGGIECFGGLFLLVGLASRLVSVPLIFTMVVAYATAEIEAARGIFHDPDAFVSAAPFLFLLTAILILAFGPGLFSVDHFLSRRFGFAAASPAARPVAG